MQGKKYQSPSPRKLKHLHEDLQECETPQSTDEVPDFDLDGVHRLVSTDVFKENVQKQREQFFQLLRKVLEGPIGMWTLITHDAFWTSPPPPRTDFVLGSESQAWSATEASQHKAIENSWTADFIDQSPLDGLRAHVVEQLRFQPPSETQIYARYCSIVQSSGMGKSRLLDEFSKGHFLIPMNLQCFNRSSDELDSAELAQVLDELRVVLNSGDEELSTHCVYLGNDLNNHKSCTGPKSDCVDVFITFDEAHTLADSFDNKHTHESRFVVLRVKLHYTTEGGVRNEGAKGQRTKVLLGDPNKRSPFAFMLIRMLSSIFGLITGPLAP
ncbi:hypothetical protein H4582DRAFT_2069178 [Lactarius indigo]|nr:hypothetical protein H4582DRAFT_2069178 [Lactarius indigo]